MLRAVVLTQYRRVADRRTDRQTDGIAVASTALAMRALRRAVKNGIVYVYYIHNDTPCSKSQNGFCSFRRVIWLLTQCFKLLSLLHLFVLNN